MYAKGDGTEVLRGSHENTDIGDFIVDYLELDLEDITQRLVKDRYVEMTNIRDLYRFSHHLFFNIATRKIPVSNRLLTRMIKNLLYTTVKIY